MPVMTAKKPVRFDDMPESKVMIARLKTLRDRQTELEATVDAASKRRYTEHQRRLQARAEALADGRPEPRWDEAPDASALVSEEELVTVRVAIGMATRQLQGIHEAESRRVLDQVLPERRKLVTDHRDALVTLRDALVRRREFMDSLGNSGVRVNLVEWPCVMLEQTIELYLEWLNKRLADHFS